MFLKSHSVSLIVLAEYDVNEYESLDGGDVLVQFFPQSMNDYKLLLSLSCNTLMFLSVSY